MSVLGSSLADTLVLRVRFTGVLAFTGFEVVSSAASTASTVFSTLTALGRPRAFLTGATGSSVASSFGGFLSFFVENPRTEFKLNARASYEFVVAIKLELPVAKL